MPKSEPEYVYWDACVIQSYIERTKGRWETLRSLLRASHDPGQPLQLVTSAWTVAEVAYFGELEKKHQLPEAYAAITDFWDSEVVEILEFHEVVAKRARDIVRKSHFEDWTIKPKDAVHVSSALLRGVVAFHTYDAKLAERVKAQYGLKAGEPNLYHVRVGKGPAPVEQIEQAVMKLNLAAVPPSGSAAVEPAAPETPEASQ